jgi:hypothetical protein
MRQKNNGIWAKKQHTVSRSKLCAVWLGGSNPLPELVHKPAFALIVILCACHHARQFQPGMIMPLS